MSGYIVNFYKYATFPSHMKGTMTEQLISESKAPAEPNQRDSLIVYGDYDRLNVERISDFCRFRDVDHYALRWKGSRQTLLLYEIEDSEITESCDILNCLSSPRKGEGNPPENLHNFIVFTMVTLNPKLHQMRGYRAALMECCRLIHKQVDEAGERLIEKDKVSCRVYGSFSSSELVVVWNVNQYVDALRLTDMLRYAYFSYGYEDSQKLMPFASLYSIITLAKSKPALRHHEEIEGKALLKIVLQDGIENQKEVRDYLCDEIRENIASASAADQIADRGHGVAGIYDFAISMPAKYLCDPYSCPFRLNKPLHWKNEKIEKYVSFTSVELYYDAFPEKALPSASFLPYKALDAVNIEGDCSLPDKIKKVHDMIYGEGRIFENEDGNHPGPFFRERGVSGLWAKYCRNGLRRVIKDFVPSSAGLCDSLDLMYSDFVHNCTNLISSDWAEDLTMQFTSIIDYIAGQFYCAQDEVGDGNPNLFSNIKGVYEIYIQMINHITQSKHTVFNIPNCHLRYMGQYDLMLHGYYGWTKRLITLAYIFPPKNGTQEKLVPFITIDVFPEIRTTMYKINHSYIETGRDEEENQDEDKIVKKIEKQLAKQASSCIISINMPLSSMTDFVRYSITLCHEISHYIIPNDRERRNVVMGMLYYAELSASICLAPVLLKLINGEMTSDQEKSVNYVLPQIRREFMAITYNTFRRYYYDIIHAEVMANLKKKRDNESTPEKAEVPAWEEYRTELQRVMQSQMLNEQALGKTFDALGKKKDTFFEAVNVVFEEYHNRYQLSSPDYFTEVYLDDFKSQLEASLSETHISTQLSKYVKDLKRLYVRDLLFFESALINDAYREACQDLFMIRIAGLNVVDYLVFLDRHRNDTNQLKKPLLRKDKLRVSMVCDYLLSEKTGSDERSTPMHVLDKFDTLADDYVQFFIRVPEMKSQAAGNGPHDCLQFLRSCFEEARENLALYFEEYRYVRDFLLGQLKDSDFVYRQPHVEDKIQELGMQGFYSKWKYAIMSKKMDDVKAGKIDPEIDCIIFNTNLEMIQNFQHQETLQDISCSINCGQGSVSFA